MSELPLPHGWIKEIDPSTSRPYWVDTKASPPRSIWVHPYEDEQYLSEHPEVKDKIGPPPAYDGPRRHSFHGESSARTELARSSKARPRTPNEREKRGFLGKLKDKAIGTKEEREAQRKERAVLEQRYLQQRIDERRRLQEMRAQHASQRGQVDRFQGQYPQQQYEGYAPNQMYGPPAGYPPPPRGSGGGFGGGFGGGRLGGGGLALPLLGGLAGGLLLGDLLDGGFNDNNGFGGGDFNDGGGFF